MKISHKLKQLIMKISIIGMGVYIIFQSVIPFVHRNIETHKEEVKIEQLVNQQVTKLNKRTDIEIAKTILQQKVENAKAMVSSINTDTELVLSTITGSKTISHIEGKGNKLFDSSITIDVDYKAIVTIPIDSIIIEADTKGLVYVSYNPSDIKCTTVEYTKYTPMEKKAPLDLVNRGYPEDNKFALLEMATEEIKFEIMERSDIYRSSRKAIEEVFTSIAAKFNVGEVNVNGTTTRVRESIYKADKLVNGIPLNRYTTDRIPNQQLNDVKAIIVHSSANSDASMQAHLNWFKNDPESVSTSFYVDFDEVGVMVEEGGAGYGIKTNKGYDNFNTISVECLEYTDYDEQIKCIENLSLVVAELKAIYPNAEIIPHTDIATDGRLCPRIFNDNTYKVMEWEEFLNIVSEVTN